MQGLTAAERRGAVVVIAIFALGAAHDLWRAEHPRGAAGPIGREARSLPPGSAGTWADSTALRPAAGSGGTSPGLDLNRATAEELDALPGIGPVLAGRILAHRARYGPFRAVDELRAVRGIGPRLLERLRPRLTVGPPGRAPGPARLPGPAPGRVSRPG